MLGLFFGKIVKIDRFDTIIKFIDGLLELGYVPYFFINIDTVIIENLESHQLLIPEFEDFINHLKFAGLDRNIVFLSTRNNRCNRHLTNQLISLTSVNDIKLILTDGEHDYKNYIQDFLLESDSIKSCNFPFFIYIDSTSNFINSSSFLLISRNNSICFEIQKTNMLTKFLLMFYKPLCEILN